MIVANLAMLRDQRRGMPETLAASPGRADVRTHAVAVAAALPITVAAPAIAHRDTR